MSPFPKTYRISKFRPKLNKMLNKAKISSQKTATMEDIIGNKIVIGLWCNMFNLPADPFSIENAIIIDNCFAWPLMIDP
jgi:hypothetical protein